MRVVMAVLGVLCLGRLSADVASDDLEVRYAAKQQLYQRYNDVLNQGLQEAAASIAIDLNKACSAYESMLRAAELSGTLSANASKRAWQAFHKGILSSDATSLADSINGVACPLYRAVAAKSSGNVVISPTSICLAAVFGYACASGSTAAEVKDALQLQFPPEKALGVIGTFAMQLAGDDGNAVTAIACSLFTNTPRQFCKRFLDQLSAMDMNGLDVIPVNESCHLAETARKWVCAYTLGRCRDIIAPEPSSATNALILANAVYFGGRWKNEFPGCQTQLASFSVSASTTVSVETMRLDHVMWCRENQLYQSLEIPYRTGRFAMYVLLPRRGVALSEVERTMTVGNVIHTTADYLNHIVVLRIPKFSFHCQISVTNALQPLGITELFQDSADLSGVLGGGKPFPGMSAMPIDASIEMSEKGTDVAAVTGKTLPQTMDREGGYIPSVEFIVDRPFVFFVLDKKTKSVLLMGRVIDPSLTN